MAMRDGYEWIEKGDGTWDVYTTDRKIAHIAQNERGEWHVASDPDHTFTDALTLLQLIERGKRDGFQPQDW